MPNPAPRIPEDHPAVEGTAKWIYEFHTPGARWSHCDDEGVKADYQRRAATLLTDAQPHLYQLFLEQDEQKLGEAESAEQHFELIRSGGSHHLLPKGRYVLPENGTVLLPVGYHKARLAVEEVGREEAERELEGARELGTGLAVAAQTVAETLSQVREAVERLEDEGAHVSTEDIRERFLAILDSSSCERCLIDTGWVGKATDFYRAYWAELDGFEILPSDDDAQPNPEPHLSGDRERLEELAKYLEGKADLGPYDWPALLRDRVDRHLSEGGR